ncbi:MAG TPA: C39 family peptidase [Candidatus Saccharibacteria bacterium]|nr:C39 family peptidase [Candidatus Saccharibacteria bacterium]
MSIHKDVPFVSNTDDDLHCLPAAYMSIAKYFSPNFSIEMDEWSALTGFEPNKGTWANAGLLWFQQNGYDVKHITLFDYDEFVKHPEDYLIEFNGADVGGWMVDHTNIDAEVARVKKLISVGLIEKRIPTIEDIKQLLDKGYLVRASLNCNKLSGKSGYVGHAVAVIGYDDQGVFLHDPGLPALPNRKVNFAQFDAAWSDPSDDMKEMDAVRLVS